jgi:uncharacterized protein (TIGR03086 family)
MMEMFAALDLAQGEFDRVLRQVGDDQWSLPTPCTEWNVYQVANHVVGANYYFIALMEGASKDEALKILSQDFLKGDPLSASEAQRPELRATFSAPGALDRTGHHVVADMTGAQLLRGSVSETAVHTWDIIQATSIQPPLDPQLAEVALGIFEQLAPIFVEHGFHRTKRRNQSRCLSTSPDGRAGRPQALGRPPAPLAS